MSNPYARQLGRLLAIIEQAGFVPDSERAYTLVSTQPVQIVPFLREATQHGGEEVRDRIGQVMVEIAPPDESPHSYVVPMTIEEQCVFALAYHHERHRLRNLPRPRGHPRKPR